MKALSPGRHAHSLSGQPTSSRGQELSPGTESSPAKCVGTTGGLSASGAAYLATATGSLGNADIDQTFLSATDYTHPLPPVIAEGSAGSRHAFSPKAPKRESSAQPQDTPNRGQRAVSLVRDKGQFPTQPMGNGEGRQMLSPARDRGISPAKLTDLRKQNDDLRFKLQVCAWSALCTTVCFVYIKQLVCFTTKTSCIYEVQTDTARLQEHAAQ